MEDFFAGGQVSACDFTQDERMAKRFSAFQ
jgi:hypothetical protein